MNLFIVDNPEPICPLLITIQNQQILVLDQPLQNIIVENCIGIKFQTDGGIEISPFYLYVSFRKIILAVIIRSYISFL